jgi:hypothetical protein
VKTKDLNPQDKRKRAQVLPVPDEMHDSLQLFSFAPVRIDAQFNSTNTKLLKDLHGARYNNRSFTKPKKKQLGAPILRLGPNLSFCLADPDDIHTTNSFKIQ